MTVIQLELFPSVPVAQRPLSVDMQMMQAFTGLFRRIWVGRSKYSLCVTLFPIDPHGPYKILTRRDLYHGMSQATDPKDVLDMITVYLGGN